MPTISNCKNCGNLVPKNAEILFEFGIHPPVPYRVCSTDCLNELYEREAAEDAEMQEWDSKCSAAIARGLKESGETFESASDGQIMHWIDKYALEIED